MMYFVFILLLVVMTLFALEKMTPDIVVIGAVIMLILTKTITSNEAFQGFGTDFMVMLISIFIIGGVIKHNAVIEHFVAKTDNLPKIKINYLIIIIMLITAVLSAFMNNTAIASVFVAPIIGLAKRMKVSASKLLMPMAFASLMGGTCTLIGTSTNVAGSSYIAQNGLAPLGMFELLPIGLPIVILGILLMAAIGKRLLPNTSVDDIQQKEFINKYYVELMIGSNSQLIGNKFIDVKSRYPAILFEQIIREGQQLYTFGDTIVREGDIFIVKADKEQNLQLIASSDFERMSKNNSHFNIDEQMGMVELLVLPSSSYIDKPINDTILREQRHIDIVSISRKGQAIIKNISEVYLKVGDQILALTTNAEIEKIKQNNNFALLSHQLKANNPNVKKGLMIFAIFFIAIILGSLKIVPISIAFLLTALIAYLTKAIPNDALMRSVDWRLIILIGGMSAFGIALTNTGGDIFLAEKIVNILAPFGNYPLLAGFMIITVLLTQPMSNAASVLVVLPIALQTANALALNPRTFAIAIILSASISMIAPFEPATLLVFSPGKYKMMHFIKVGGLLTLLALLIIIIMVPIFWKF